MIAAGHRWPDIQQYTLAQIDAFLAEISAQEKRDAENQVLIVHAGTWGKAE